MNLIRRNRSMFWTSAAFLTVTALYLFFPTANSTNDAYAYAAYIRYGYALLEPFHMLHNVAGNIFYRILSTFSNPDALSMMKVLNSIAAVGCLFVLFKILRNIEIDHKQSILLVLCCSFCFGVWRFATENETYIFPIFFSLLGSYHFQRYLVKPSGYRVLMAGFFSGFACFFHVIHIFWWFGLLVGLVKSIPRGKLILLFILPSLLVPAFYLVAVPFYQNCNFSPECFWNFFSPTLESENVQYKIGTDNFYLGAINIIRTFYQVHGYMFFMIKNNLLYVVPGIISVLLLVAAVYIFFKRGLFDFKPGSHFIFSHILIFVLQFLFAVYSKGNAEFMVMLPFLSVVIMAFYLRVDFRFLTCMFFSLFIWNLSYGILPNHFADFNKRELLLKKIKEERTSIFIMEQGKEIQNQYFYRTGIEDVSSVMKLMKNKEQMDSLLARHEDKKVYTDFYNNFKVLSRYSMTRNTNMDFMKCYKYEKADSFRNFYGINYIYRIIR